jgi:hypothetical protein
LKRGHALAKLAPRLRGDDGDAALDEAHAAVMGGTGNQQNAQMALEIALGYSEPRRPSALLKTLDWVRQSTSGLTRAMALCQYAPHLDDREERRNVLAEALAFVSTSKDHLAIELLPMIATEFPEQALSVATTLGTPGARADAVASIAPHLSKIQRHAIIPEVMAGLLDVKDALHAAWPLSGFAPYLPETLLPRALTALKDIPDAGERGRAFVTFAQHTDGRHRAECIDGAITAAFEHDADRLAGRAELLAALLPLLSGPKYLRVLSDLTESWFRVSRPMVWRQLGKVVPSLARIGGPAAVRSAFLSVRDVSEWWP